MLIVMYCNTRLEATEVRLGTPVGAVEFGARHCPRYSPTATRHTTTFDRLDDRIHRHETMPWYSNDKRWSD